MTFDQQMPGLFLTYCEEHMEVHKGKGLASASNPLDMEVLTETGLAEKNARAWTTSAWTRWSSSAGSSTRSQDLRMNKEQARLD